MRLAITLLGGIGIFLLGMVLLTEGLKDAAGSALRDVLSRLTGGPARAAASGAAITAIVQSSSATTVATIGFVSAGLLTFPQSVGVILGANIGTTSTGWIVSILGLKADLATAALPLIAIGTLMRLMGRDRVAAGGLALAGFGLIFVGIDFMQGGMAGVADRIDLRSFAPEGIAGRLVLILVGIVMTVLMQSSSAAIATTLTAVHAGAIDVDAAAALTIGQAVGTTVTAGIAAIGATIAARRTALAHVSFNLMTGTLAFLLLPFVSVAAEAAWLRDDPAIVVAGFQTTFKVLGVLLVLPFTAQFASAIERILPERPGALTGHLDSSVASVAPIALEVGRRTLLDVAAVACRETQAVLTGSARGGRQRTDEVREALAETRRFLALVRTSPDSGEEHVRHVNLLHALDHLHRLIDALDERDRQEPVRHGPPFADEARRLALALEDAIEWCAHPDGQNSPAGGLGAVSAGLAETRRRHRRELLADAATRLDPDDAIREIDALLWLDRVAYHVWRATVHLAGEEDRTSTAQAAEGDAYPEPEPVPQD